MAGNDHIPTAPKDVIGDDGDLRQMRDALRAGKRVTLASDGHVYVGTEAGTPMSDVDETWIESKLGHVVEMARQGYGVSVSPDGSISADRADHLAKARYDNDPGFNEQDIILIKTGIQDGALVRLHTDGHIEYFLPKDAVKPSPADAARLQTFVDEEISSGRLEAAWRNGETLAAKPDGSVVYQRVEEGPAPIEFPEDGGQVEPVPTTADELEAEALGLELGAGAARLNTLDEYETGATDAATGRDAAARQRATAEAAVKVADSQFDEKQTVAARIAAEQVEVANRAEQYRVAGDLERAEEMTEKLARLNVEHRIAEREVTAAKAAADVSRADVAKHAADEATYEGKVRESWTERTRNEEVQDNQEDQARVYRRAAAEMGEAERLDAAYADLEARGVAGSERVKVAADQARRRAEALRTEAESHDKQPDWATSPDDPAPLRPIRPNPGVFGDDLSDASGTGAGVDSLGVDSLGTDSLGTDSLATDSVAAASAATDDGIEMPAEFVGDGPVAATDHAAATSVGADAPDFDVDSNGIGAETGFDAGFDDGLDAGFDAGLVELVVNDVDPAGGFEPVDDFAADPGLSEVSMDDGFAAGSFGDSFEG